MNESQHSMFLFSFFVFFNQKRSCAIDVISIRTNEPFFTPVEVGERSRGFIPLHHHHHRRLGAKLESNTLPYFLQMISTTFSFASILVGDSTMKTYPLLLFRSQACAERFFSDGQASKDWPSAMHDHMSISFNIPLTRWPPLSVVLYKHFAGFSPSVLLPTNEWASIFSRACRQSRLIMHRGFRVVKADGGLARAVAFFH